VPLEEVEVAGPRLQPPAEMEEMFSADHHARLSHAMGKAYRDVVRGTPAPP
jgi:hypothetical protein